MIVATEKDYASMRNDKFVGRVMKRNSAEGSSVRKKEGHALKG
jgi:hypothetical protein